MKRPFLWILGGFLILCFLFQKGWEKKQTPIPLEREERVPVQAAGVLERYEKKPSSYHLYLRSVLVYARQKHFSIKKIVVTVDSFEEESYALGNHVKITGNLEKFYPPTNPGSFDEKAYYLEKGISYRIRADSVTIRSHDSWFLKNKLLDLKKRLCTVYETSMSEQDAGIICAMLLGEKSELDREVKERYQKNGIGHLLAISGLHVSILCLTLYRLLLMLGIPTKAGFVLTMLFSLAYGEMTGFQISTNRAVVMMLLLLLSSQVARSYDVPTAMAVSAFVILFQEPYALCSVSFLLSYSAVGGVVFVFPALEGLILGTTWEQEKRRREKSRKKSYAVLSSFLCSVSVNLSTLPVLLYFYYEIPSYSVLLNLIVLPFAGALVVLSALGGILGVAFLPFAKGVLVLVHGILAGYDWLCRFFMKLPEPILIFGCPSVIQIILYALILGGVVWYTRNIVLYQIHFPRWKRYGFFCLLFLATLLLLYRPKLRGVSCTMLDVGQGDGIVIQTESGHTILLDGGSSSVSAVGKYRILPYLKYCGIRRIDYMIMTHEDEDHISGQLELLTSAGGDGVTIGSCLLPEPASESTGENYRLIQEAAKHAGVPVRFLHRGDVLSFGKVMLSCLHPEKDFKAESANAYSTTLLLTYGKFSLLLTGDLEKNGEQAVIDTWKKGREITVLKVAHHGSKYTTDTELLKKLHPKLAVISCGRKNRYGHPHPELLERLDRLKIPSVRTDQRGAIAIQSDGKTWNVKTSIHNF